MQMRRRGRGFRGPGGHGYVMIDVNDSVGSATCQQPILLLNADPQIAGCKCRQLLSSNCVNERINSCHLLSYKWYRLLRWKWWQMSMN